MNKGITNREELNDLWNYARNQELGISFESITSGSVKKAWWKCEEGHEWQAAIYSVVNGCRCPYCANKKVLPGFNDLATIYPQVAKEWDQEKNGDIKPELVLKSSNKKYWWICKEGHKWEAAPSTRIKGHGCPYCAGQKVMPGFNDLESKYPSLCEDWDVVKNYMKPSEITYGSGKKVWWKCRYCGYSWQSAPVDRIRGTRCPSCSNSQTSISEQALFYYIKKYFSNAQNRYKEAGIEFDVYIPDRRIALEYDGVFYHANRVVQDNRKDCYCHEHDISLIRIREHGLKNTEYAKCILRENNNRIEDLEKCIKKALNNLGVDNIDVDFKRDVSTIVSQYCIVRERDSLKTKYPFLMADWDYDNNKPLKPEYISANSHIKVWWKCNKGHSWEATIHQRAGGGSGCPFCSGLRVVQGENDLEVLFPELIKEWDYSKNNGLLPCDVKAKSGKAVWWKCAKCGHEWKAIIGNRTKGVGCPKCANAYRNIHRSIMEIKNGKPSLEKEFPILAKEWNYEKNTLKPSEVQVGSRRKVWWKCEEGHDWQAAVVKRVKGSGCPFCCNRKLLTGYNDLETKCPSLAKEWNYEKNNGVTPVEIIAGSTKRFWWKCSKCGHEWEASASYRIRITRCPKCGR